MKSAVLFLVFNRPNTTKSVFEAIRAAQPPRLYISADGPRLGKVGEVEKCKEVREIALAVDWNCEVKTLFREKNIGCKYGVSSGIDWFFQYEEDGIILEDDCLPHPCFFKFCDEMLEKYRNSENIAIVSGFNDLFNNVKINQSYYFSSYPKIWGWATWKRVWDKYDVLMTKWENCKQNNCIEKITLSRNEKKYWLKWFDRVADNKLDTWDYQLSFLAMSDNLLSIIPNVSLISNIGFGNDMTHTNFLNKLLRIGHINYFSNTKTFELKFPLSHPESIVRNYLADRYTSIHYLNDSYIRKIKRKIYSICEYFLGQNKSSM